MHVQDLFRVLVSVCSWVNPNKVPTVEVLALRLDQLLQVLEVHAEYVMAGITERAWFDANPESAQLAAELTGH